MATWVSKRFARAGAPYPGARRDRERLAGVPRADREEPAACRRRPRGRRL